MMKYSVVLAIVCTLFSSRSSGQTKAELIASKKMYEGRWINKNLKRHLSIDYDNSPGYANINDWQGKLNDNNNTVDVYKAWIKNGILVMPESKTDLRCPYCEILKKDKSLLYRCRGMNTNSRQFIDSVWFIREKP